MAKTKFESVDDEGPVSAVATVEAPTPEEGPEEKFVYKGENHCPFGCKDDELDDSGYCRHLLGFTNDGKWYEEIRVMRAWDRDGRERPSGRIQVVGGKRGRERKEVLGTDRLVNPEFDQLVDGIVHKTKKWVSARVYRALG